MIDLGLEFHHLGVACKDLDAETRKAEALGYTVEAPDFVDMNQGVRGRFLIGGGPRLELLCDLEDRRTVAGYIERGIRIYHQGYLVRNFSEALSHFRGRGAKMLRPPLPAIAFNNKEVVFLAIDRSTMIELIDNS